MLHPIVTSDRRAIGEAHWPLHSVAASRAWEARAAQDLPAHTLMHRAGFATARFALAVAPHAHIHSRALRARQQRRRRAAGRLASPSRWQVGTGLADVDREPTARCSRSLARGPRRRRADQVRTSAGAARVIARTGHRCLVRDRAQAAPEGLARQMIEVVRASDAEVLAVDAPTGLDADTGAPIDPLATVRARWTLSLLTLKPGLFTGGGRDHAGEIWFDDLDVTAPAATSSGQLVTDTSAMWPSRNHAQHKGSLAMYGSWAARRACAAPCGWRLERACRRRRPRDGGPCRRLVRGRVRSAAP